MSIKIISSCNRDEVRAFDGYLDWHGRAARSDRQNEAKIN